MDVFSAFPGAVVSDRYYIAVCQRGTLEGNKVLLVSSLNVIVDEGDAGDIGNAPNSETLIADLLMYTKPSELPTLNPRELVAGYLVYDELYKDYFRIIDASIGKNQETGAIEHVELRLRQTDALEAEES